MKLDLFFLLRIFFKRQAIVHTTGMPVAYPFELGQGLPAVMDERSFFVLGIPDLSHGLKGPGLGLKKGNVHLFEQTRKTGMIIKDRHSDKDRLGGEGIDFIQITKHLDMLIHMAQQMVEVLYFQQQHNIKV